MPETIDELKTRRAAVVAAANAQVAKINADAKASAAAIAATATADVASIDLRIATFGLELLDGTPIGTAGSYNNNGFTIARVFDGDLATYFDAPAASADKAWVGLDLGEPRTIAAVAYAPRAGWVQRMVGGTVQVSNDPAFAAGVSRVLTVNAAPAAGVLTVAAVGDSGAYRYVRYCGPKGSFCNVAAFAVYATPKPVQRPPIDVTLPPRRCRFGLIMDAIDDRLIDELGAAGVRLWGNFGTNGTISASVMNRANALAKAGRDTAIVVTPKTRLAPGSVIDFTAVVDQLVAQADRRIRPNLVNEGMQLEYWPDGGDDVGARWLDAMRATQSPAKRLSAAGFVPGCASVTGYDERWEAWFAQADAEGLLDAFPRLAFHIYGGDLGTVRRRAALAREIADRYGKQLDFDECGFGKATSLEYVTAMFPAFLDAIGVADYASWFIATKTNDPAKPDHDRWAWFVDPKTGERREAWIAVAKAELARVNGALQR